MPIHQVVMGQKITDIARVYGVSPATLADINGLTPTHRPAEGREILVLTPTRTYNVKKNDTLSAIAKRFGTIEGDLIRINPSLGGESTVYEGQVLAIRYDSQSFGLSAANGYCFSGTTRERLRLCMPYASIITVCAARQDGQGIKLLFDDSEVLREIKAGGCCPFLRIYMNGTLPHTDHRDGFINSAAILARSHGYMGVTISEISGAAPKEYDEFVLKMQRRMMECDLSLIIECCAEGYNHPSEFADGCVLTYERLSSGSDTSFEDSERRAFENFAHQQDSQRAFIDLSSFALLADKYIPLTDAFSHIDRRGAKVTTDQKSLISRADLGKAGCNSARVCFESLKNTKAKLDLVWELGYMGISFDIMRVPIQTLMLFASMFQPAKGSNLSPTLNCRGETV